MKLRRKRETENTEENKYRLENTEYRSKVVKLRRKRKTEEYKIRLKTQNSKIHDKLKV